jgi:predicted molibdopterin-dependent oxidoreductase YjgC
VLLVSRYGSATLPVRLNPAVQGGQPFATSHTAGVFLNRLTGPRRDAAVGTPEYQVVAVRIESGEESSSP